MRTADPLSVTCPICGSKPGEPCAGCWPNHKGREKAARAASRDADIDDAIRARFDPTATQEFQWDQEQT